jgi:hypothetical protein
MKSFWTRTLLVFAFWLCSSSVFSLQHIPGDRVADQALQNVGFTPYFSDQNTNLIEAASPFTDYGGINESIRIATWGWVPYGSPRYFHYSKPRRKLVFVCFTPNPKKPEFSRTRLLQYAKASFFVRRFPRRYRFGRCENIPPSLS